MKILLLGEYSNVHNTLAKGLRTLGHEITVASNGDFWKNYPRDIDLSRSQGKRALLTFACKVAKTVAGFRGYDIVQLINPIFIELTPRYLTHIYRYLRRHNRKIVLCAFGMDYYWVHTCMTDMPLRYSDFNLGKKLRTDVTAQKEIADWIGTPKEKLNKLIADDCDAIVTGLYEYHVCYQQHFPQKTTYIPYPIVSAPMAKPFFRNKYDKLKMFIGISKNRSQYKGTDVMLQAAQDLQMKYPDKMTLNIVEGVPFSQYVKLMEESDLLLDQLYSYTPAMNALEAMNKGIVCVGGGEPENYQILKESELRPIVNVEPTYESVYNQLEQLVLHPDKISRLQDQSIQYIRRHHDYMKVAKQYEQLYCSLL